MMLLHPHAIGKIMPNPTAAAIKAGEVLSAGAKTYLNRLAKEHVYGYREKLDTKPIQKGLECEDASIELFNSVFFTDYVKNTERVKNEWLTGECDIQGDDVIVDIKTPWSLATFPSTPEDGENPDYEWQLRAYMMLYEKPRAVLAYCLVDTPERLMAYEDEAVHRVSHLPAAMRVTVLHFDRDAEKEAQMIEKCKAAQVYIEQQIERIKNAHKF